MENTLSNQLSDATTNDVQVDDTATTTAIGGGGSSDLLGLPGLSAPVNPVLFWNDVALDLVALDHSVDVGDSRAIGPCLSARALGLVHAVLADAVRVAYPAARYGAFRNVAVSGGPVREPASFVGGAVAAILRHIYDSTSLQVSIDTRRAAFLRSLGGGNLNDWRRGSAFGSDQAYTREWDGNDLRALINPRDTTYRPSPGRHDVDPFNPGQGFYGQRWGQAFPFVLTPGEIAAAAIAPPPPPLPGSTRYEQDLADVRARGALHGSALDPQRTPEQEDVGLFWAYDGARLIGTPLRLYNQIVVEVARRDRMSVVELARLLALCNLAMADASIVAWRSKYDHAVWRPVLGIRNRQNASPSDREWRPLGAPRTNRPDFTLGRGASQAAFTRSLLDSEPSGGDAASVQSLLGSGTGGGGTTFAQSLLGGDPGGGSAASGQAQPGGSGNGKQASPASLDPDYTAAAFTPNFPAYPSGHATFGGACFEVLRRVRAERALTRRAPDSLQFQLGGLVIRGGLTFVSDELNGVSVDNFRDEPRPLRPQRFATIEQMIDLNDDSRVWLGVHWKFDADEGETSGKAVAETVYNRALRRT